MSTQSSSKSDVNNCSMTNDNNPTGVKQTIIFEWTTELEECMLQNMIKLKPCGINKHLSMHLIQRNINKEMNIKIPIDVLWNYVESKLDMKAADRLEPINFDIIDKDFSLPEEYNQSIIEQGEIIKKLQKECLIEEANKKKLLNLSGKTRSKSNSISSVDSKEGLNETIPSTLLESSSAKKNKVGSDDGPCTRRSLRTNDKLENSKSDEKNKLKDSKQLNKKTSNQSKDAEKIELISNFRGRKMKSRNMSESSCRPEIKIERLKPEKQFASLVESKSKNLINSKNEANKVVTAKIRNRVTSDLLVVQQSPDIQSLGRRSCSNKNL
ncbi:hypothetical protein ACI65C_005307 [Semiaphis heraclei]